MNPEPLADVDLGDVIPLLVEAGLPVDDVAPASGIRFLVLREAADVIATGALEVYGPDALVRSVAVAPARRGEGLGRRIVGALEALARGAGVRDLWLLTTTAAPFFEREGFVVADRAVAPDAIRATAQFADLCPDSATFMHRRMG